MTNIGVASFGGAEMITLFAPPTERKFKKKYFLQTC